jgi:hypothetical protein
MSDHPATTRAGHYRRSGGQPVFGRTFLKETKAWLRKRERERAKAEARERSVSNDNSREEVLAGDANQSSREKVQVQATERRRLLRIKAERDQLRARANSARDAERHALQLLGEWLSTQGPRHGRPDLTDLNRRTGRFLVAARSARDGAA